jgi:DNA polymerase-3 subunit epsilon
VERRLYYNKKGVNNMVDSVIENALSVLRAHPKQFRVLEALPYLDKYADDDGEDKFIGVVVDVETTGLEEDAKVIELGLVSFEFASSGKIYRVLEAHSFYNDPGFAIPPEVVKITGITDADVENQRIDTERVAEILRKTD